MTAEEHASLVVLAVFAIVSIVAMILLLAAGSSESPLPLMAQCVPDETAAPHVASGEWVLWKSSCCPKPVWFFGCAVDRKSYDLVIPAGALAH